MVLGIYMITNTLNRLLSMTKYGFDNINGGFEINYLPSEYLTNFTSETYENTFVEDIIITLTSVRLH